MADDARAQDGVPLWGTPDAATVPAEQTGAVGPVTPAGTSGPPAWGTAQRPRGAARRLPKPPPAEPPGWRAVTRTGLFLLASLAVLAGTLFAIGPPEDRADRVLAHGSVTTATVVEVRQWVGAKDVTLRYPQDGRGWTVHRGTNDETPSGLAVGDSLIVWVDPQDPGWAYARELDPIPGWENVPIAVGFVVGAAGVLITGLMFLGTLAGQLGGLAGKARQRRRAGREPRAR